MNIKKAFTLSETMIVIVVLGIIATLTIPALVNKNKESVAKTKLRKAMAAYESALNKMIIENDLKDNGPLNDWAGAVDNCGNPTQYFKKVQGDGCVFKTSDGVWWNISDIERPLIAFKQDDLTTEKANDQNDYSAFVLVGRFGNDGSLRVDDLAYETANSIADAHGNQSKAQVEKLYGLLGVKTSSGEETCDNNDYFCRINKEDDLYKTLPTCTEEKKSCVIYEFSGYDWCCSNAYMIYDNEGNKVGKYNVSTKPNGDEYVSFKAVRVNKPDGNEILISYSADGNSNYALYKNHESIDYSDGANTVAEYTFDSNGNHYKYFEQVQNADCSYIMRTEWDVDSNNNVYKKYESVEGDNGYETRYNPDGTYCKISFDEETGDEIKEGSACEE